MFAGYTSEWPMFCTSPIRYFEMYILCCSISKWPVMFAGYTSEWPMFCRSVDSFPFRQISGARYVLF